jgi:hypothetical protein
MMPSQIEVNCRRSGAAVVYSSVLAGRFNVVRSDMKRSLV